MKASLLANESTGGAIAREGFGYQDAFVLQHLPRWLAQGAFSHVVSEAVGDIEVCYFGMNGITVRTFFEAKSYALSWSVFWDEIRQFKKVHDTSPTEFPRFVLVCRDFNSNTSPLVAMISRLRGVGSSYDANSPMLAQTREEIIQWIVDKKQPRELAQFVVDRVDFVTYADENAHAAFSGEIECCLPSINLRAKDAAAFREHCVRLVTRSGRGPVMRGEIEAALLGVLAGDTAIWEKTPTLLSLADVASVHELCLIVEPFNGPARATLKMTDWQHLSARAAAIGEFIKRSRPRSTIALSSKQRISLACLLGYTFGATKGFILDIEHNGAHFRTDEHVQETAPFFTDGLSRGDDGMKEGVVSIAFPTSADADVAVAIAGNLARAPRLELTSSDVIDSALKLNRAVAEAKSALVEFRSCHRLDVIHLFIKAPSHFAMMLGHRLNAVGCIQLYDWVDNSYVATCLLTP
ncbi:hypothetical protein SAMN05216466_10140 [Paraburkholderia phenazinium]|uniref:Uncharacterized protein n=1 Tax=Paraburkholderia phenazinium TaxID=60549 RepID=A0A1G7NWF0_9BURK|nr:dsDNA nuclease domain-containing protein [Paraburkholderia phenazinium]SDF77689.1 hypothetical protein SAMN05216466_10140 [Paraburkholderia phenazinium]